MSNLDQSLEVARNIKSVKLWYLQLCNQLRACVLNHFSSGTKLESQSKTTWGPWSVRIHWHQCAYSELYLSGGLRMHCELAPELNRFRMRSSLAVNGALFESVQSESRCVGLNQSSSCVCYQMGYCINAYRPTLLANDGSRLLRPYDNCFVIQWRADCSRCTCCVVGLAASRHYTPCVKKNNQNCFCHNFVKFSPTLIIFGTKMVKRIELCKVHSFTTSPNLCQCTTV